ncbi:hypothetical protein [Paenibacillus ehimensis]|nr:hypothetical protein [Paenibacillus ehimensis]
MKKIMLLVMLSCLIFGTIQHFPLGFDYSKGIVVQYSEGDPGM